MYKLSDFDLDNLPYDKQVELLDLLEKDREYYRYNYIDTLFPEDGLLSIHRYPKHIEFFSAGGLYKHRMIMAGNRSGKSYLSCYEVACHLTGIYPIWWDEIGGKRLSRACDWVIIGEETKLLRLSIVDTLLGPLDARGTKMIRRTNLDLASLTETKKSETTISSFRVKHISGAYCNVEFRTYEMPRTSFQAFTANILFDEEPPEDIYLECLMRPLTLGIDGMTIMNFTPMKGPTKLLTNFLEGHPYTTGPISESKHLTHFSMDDAPHLSAEDIESEMKNIPVYMRDARRKGLPMAGEGLIYPWKEELIFIDPLPYTIPDDWKRFFALDYGWEKPTAIAWFVIDPNTDIVYQYAEHYVSEQPVSTHARAIHQMNNLAGFDIPGVCDPSRGGKGLTDGSVPGDLYRDQFGIDMISAKNSILAGHATVYQRIVDSKFKVFKNCMNTCNEWRGYAMKKGKPTGEDHLMDCWKYGLVSGIAIAKSKAEFLAQKELQEIEYNQQHSYGENDWMRQ